MKKVANVLNTLFGVGVLLALFAGGIAVLGYIVAMFIGGETATELCRIIYKEYFAWIIKFTSVFIGCGLIGMYLDKKKALTIQMENTSDAVDDK